MLVKLFSMRAPSIPGNHSVILTSNLESSRSLEVPRKIDPKCGSATIVAAGTWDLRLPSLRRDAGSLTRTESTEERRGRLQESWSERTGVTETWRGWSEETTFWSDSRKLPKQADPSTSDWSGSTSSSTTYRRKATEGSSFQTRDCPGSWARKGKKSTPSPWWDTLNSIFLKIDSQIFVPNWTV